MTSFSFHLQYSLNALHPYLLYIAAGRDILGGVALYENEVGAFAHFDRATVTESEDVGSGAGSTVKDVEVREACVV